MTHKTHTFSASERAFVVNSFALEGERSVAVIGTQLLVSSARALTIHSFNNSPAGPFAAGPVA